jgi:hypothetical protein
METEDEEARIRDALMSGHMDITKKDLFMLDNIDSFVALSLDNTSIKYVDLFPFDSDAGTYEFWDKVGHMVGNLMELQTLTIYGSQHDYDSEVEEFRPDWETLTRTLRYLRRKVTLSSCIGDYDAEGEEIRGLARAIHGHPMISEFRSEAGFTFANVDPWCTALATLPSLERVTLRLKYPETEDERVMANAEPLVQLLRAPALRFVDFDDFCFTNALCHATANALEEGSSVTDIIFGCNCSFPDRGRTIIANALKSNTSVTKIQFSGDFSEPFCNVLAAVLCGNSTLQNLTVLGATRATGSGRWFSSIFLSLRRNTTLKSLTLGICDELGGGLSAAITIGLANNSMLEDLTLYNMVPSGDDGAASARNTLSFLRTNSSLKSLIVSFGETQQELYVSAFRLEAVKMVEEKTVLETLFITTCRGIIKFEELLALISALQLNTTLKILGYQEVPFSERPYLADEVNQLVSILMKNYGLEHLEPYILSAGDQYGDPTVKAILRLNRAGRRYLIEDEFSISKGVEVLSGVNDDINCVFFHLLENPGLCERRAIETETTTTRVSIWTKPLVVESESELNHNQARNPAVV